MQGRLTGERLVVTVRSECHHCSQPITLEVDDQLRFRVRSADASPLIFEPDVNWDTFYGSNIIHDY